MVHFEEVVSPLCTRQKLGEKSHCARETALTVPARGFLIPAAQLWDSFGNVEFATNTMATIYFRKTSKSGTSGLWWVKFYHPLDFKCHRVSLGTADKNEAETILRSLELEIEVRRTEPVPLPQNLTSLLGPSAYVPAAAAGSDYAPDPAPARSTTVFNALRSYYAHIKAENDSHHIDSKLSILRAFFGSSVVEEATGKSCRNITPAYYLSKTLDDLTPVLLQDFVASRKISDKSKKHYRELFHHFIEKMIDLALFVPSNPLRPNPAAALPSYQPKNDVII